MNPERITGKRGLIFLIGFLVFLVGYISVFFEFEFFEFLKVIGALVSLFAIFKLRNAGPRTVGGVKNEDGLTYFLEQCGCPAFECYALLFMLFSTLAYLLIIIVKFINVRSNYFFIFFRVSIDLPVLYSEYKACYFAIIFDYDI
jgi:hypothetical protein